LVAKDKMPTLRLWLQAALDRQRPLMALVVLP
jgi:hypothetical protein